jgi:hypothetical protein
MRPDKSRGVGAGPRPSGLGGVRWSSTLTRFVGGSGVLSLLLLLGAGRFFRTVAESGAAAPLVGGRRGDGDGVRLRMPAPGALAAWCEVVVDAF